MKCSNCSNIAKSLVDCNFCGGKFCCFTCFDDHYLKFHRRQNVSSKSHSRKKEVKDNDKQSPYLIKGLLNKKIKYNSKYKLENFTPVMEKNEIKTIGSGSFGQVYLAKNNIDNKLYAIKHMDKRKLMEILHTLKGIYQEIDIQSRIDHPNIVKILYTDEDEECFDLVMEYAENGNLFHYIRKNKGLNEFKTFQLFIQVVNAINFLHENDLIHRDIKPENILLFNNSDKNIKNLDYIVKLCDFGWCVKLDGKQRDTFCGTTEYMSPELVNHKVYSKEIDVWSLGVLLYEMIHGYSPFRPNKPKFSENDVFENIKKHNLKFGKKISDECKKLIYNLLAFNKNKRFKVEDIYNSKFVKKFEKLIVFPHKENEENKINLNKKNSIINNEENNDNDSNNSKNKNNKKIFEVYNELKNLNRQELRKLLKNNIIEHKIIKSLSKNKNLEKEKNYNLSLVVNNNNNNNSISFIYNNTSRNLNKSSNDIFINKDKIQDKKYSSLQYEFKYEYKKKIIKDKNKKKEKDINKDNLKITENNKKEEINYASFIKEKEKKRINQIHIINKNNKKNIFEEKKKNKKKSKTNSISPIKINTNSCDKKINNNLNDYNSQSISYRLKETIKNDTNRTNKSIKRKIEIQNIKNEKLKENKNMMILLKNRTYGNEKQVDNKINKKIQYSDNNKDLRKIKSICNIKNIFNNNKRKQNSFFYDSLNNEIINNDTIKYELFNQQFKKNPFEGMKMKSKTNFSLNKSDEIKQNNSKIIINNSNIKDCISSDRKIKDNKINIFEIKKCKKKKNISTNSKNNKQKKINSKDKSNIKKRNNSPKLIQAGNKKRKTNSAQHKNKNYNRIRMRKNYSNKIYNEKIFHNNSCNNINRSFNKNILQAHEKEKENEINRIQSDKYIFKIKENKMNSPKNGKSIIIKSQKSEKNKKFNDKKIKKIANIKVNNKNKEMIIQQDPKITNIKLRNKKSFCFISRNKLFSQNKYHHIFCGPINKINNINYQSNNINNFYIINGTNTNINNDNNSKMSQKTLKKQLTEAQKTDVKNINYQKFILPIEYFQNEYIKENENITKSVSKSKGKISFKHYQITKKNKISHSYNKKNHLKKKKSNKESGDIRIDDDSVNSSNDNEKNITPKKKKDNVKINPIKLLGDFKKEYNTFYENNKNISQNTGYKL